MLMIPTYNLTRYEHPRPHRLHHILTSDHVAIGHHDEVVAELLRLLSLRSLMNRGHRQLAIGGCYLIDVEPTWLSRMIGVLVTQHGDILTDTHVEALIYGHPLRILVQVLRKGRA